jgi:hypothetical protein
MVGASLAFAMTAIGLRDSSVSEIVRFCVRVNDLRTARILVRAIQAISIREDVLNEHQVLRR